PSRATAVLPRVSWPAAASRVFRPGNRVGAPEMFARGRIPAIDKSSDAVFRAGNAGKNDTIGDQRCQGLRISVIPVYDLRLPHLLAGLRIERDHMRVERGAEHLSLIERAT